MPDSFIRILQFMCVAAMWVFVTSVTLWVLQLAYVSYTLKDAYTASVGISLVALPVFWTLAGVLSYTFFGIRHGRRQ